MRKTKAEELRTGEINHVHGKKVSFSPGCQFFPT
jgi:hypothetical protein